MRYKNEYRLDRMITNVIAGKYGRVYLRAILVCLIDEGRKKICWIMKFFPVAKIFLMITKMNLAGRTTVLIVCQSANPMKMGIGFVILSKIKKGGIEMLSYEVFSGKSVVMSAACDPDICGPSCNPDIFGCDPNSCYPNTDCNPFPHD